MTLSEKNIYFTAYGLLSGSFLIFTATHLKFPFAITLSALFVFSLFYFLKQIQKEKKDTFQIPGRVLLLLIMVSFLLVYISGVGGYFPQKLDLAWRNALFRDMIMKDWPVTYQIPELFKLVYYFNYWLVPAAFAKMFIPFGEKIAVEIGNLGLFLWTILWLFEILLLICCKFKKFSFKAVILITIIFMGFSGLDCIGWLLRFIKEGNFYFVDHLEWWTYRQYSSHFTQLAWVFNQAIPAWLCTMLLYKESNVWNNIGAFSFCFIFSPFPAVGFAGIVFCIFACKAVYLIRQKSLCKLFNKDSIIANMLIFVSIVPILSLFYLSNSRTNSSGHGLPIYFLIKDYHDLINYILFVVLEVGVYVALLFFNNKRNTIFYIISAELLVFPLFDVVSFDFCMRSSIPALCLLSLLVIDFFLYHRREQTCRCQSVLLIIVFLIGIVTPSIEFISSVLRYRELPWRDNHIYTFDRPDSPKIMWIENFQRKDANNTFFFKYLAKDDR